MLPSWTTSSDADGLFRIIMRPAEQPLPAALLGFAIMTSATVNLIIGKHFATLRREYRLQHQTHYQQSFTEVVVPGIRDTAGTTILMYGSSASADKNLSFTS